MAADVADDPDVVRGWILAEARRLQKRQEAIRRRLHVLRALLRLLHGLPRRRSET